MKNISTAIQMYLTDYEKLMPFEHRQEVSDFYSCASGWGTSGWLQRGTRSNPYMRDQLILEEYVRNRDIWRCPSAKLVPTGWSVNGNINGEDWFARMYNFSGGSMGSGCPFQSCNPTFPPGWGGNITDGITQGWPCRRSDMGPGAFEYNYNTLYDNRELKTSQITDPARWLVVTEIGAMDGMNFFSPGVAYPDICKLGCATSNPAYPDCINAMATWETCSWATECGAGDPRLGSDVTYRKEFITTRHLGGVNLGFADGHASWMMSEAVMIGVPDSRPFIPEGQKNRNPAIVGPIYLCNMPDL